MHDGEAFLLERLGDVTAALNLYVRSIEQCNASFVEQALQGHVQLPLVAGSRYLIDSVMLGRPPPAAARLCLSPWLLHADQDAAVQSVKHEYSHLSDA